MDSWRGQVERKLSSVETVLHLLGRFSFVEVEDIHFAVQKRVFCDSAKDE